MAEEFGVSVPVIAGITGAALRRLAQQGLTASDLREAARHATEATAMRPFVEPNRFSSGTHSHHRSRVDPLMTHAAAGQDHQSAAGHVPNRPRKHREARLRYTYSCT